MNEITQFNATGIEAAESETLPHSVEAEQQLLGAILTNNDIFDRVASIVGTKHFFDPVHARSFETASNRIAKNALASPVTLKTFLEDDEGLKELGGPAYLARLAGAAISAFAARDYAQMIYDLAIRRDLGARPAEKHVPHLQERAVHGKVELSRVLPRLFSQKY